MSIIPDFESGVFVPTGGGGEPKELKKGTMDNGKIESNAIHRQPKDELKIGQFATPTEKSGEESFIFYF